jgi:drug/metabolite transporter (DMT)-like permease
VTKVDANNNVLAWTAVNRASGIFLALASAGLSAIQYPLNKFALVQGLTTSSAAVFETVFTILFCLIANIFSNDKTKIMVSYQIFVIGTMNAVAVVLLFNALNMLPPPVVGFWGRLYFAFSLLCSIGIIKEKIGVSELIASGLLILGLLAYSHGGAAMPTGAPLVMVIAYPAIFALQNALIKKHLCDYPASAILISQKFYCLILLLGYFWITKSPIIPSSIAATSILALSTLLSSFLSLWAFYLALTKIDFLTVNLMRGTSPLFVIVISAPFFPVVIDFIGWLGVATIAISAILPAIINMRKLRYKWLAKFSDQNGSYATECTRKSDHH